nr:NAD+ synthase [Acidimicrobiales bacterium]
MRLRLALAQFDVMVGDLAGNAARVVEAMAEAEAEGCELLAFPELVLTGYPPEDLLLKPSFVDDNLEALDRVVAASGSTVALVGFVDRDPEHGHLYNAAAVCADGVLRGVYRKRRLPNYAVFDEERYFEPGAEPLTLWGVAGLRVGVSICEDAWAPDGPVRWLGDGGADLVVNLNASPYHAGKVAERERMLEERAAEAGCWIAYVNLVGGQDELVFDGASVVVDSAGDPVTRAPQYADVLFVTDLDVPARSMLPASPLPVTTLVARPVSSPPVAVTEPARLLDRCGEVYGALVTGTRDYVRKNGFGEVVIGLSGGVDSSLVAAVACDALGSDRVHGVLMPSRYSSSGSITDAELLAANLGIEYRVITIEPAFKAFEELLGPSFVNTRADVTEENLQPRIRGMLLMALSNKFGWLVLTTSNKSESAVGYTTLYGDMAGGFAVIKDVPKLLVYELCGWLNRRGDGEVVPREVLVKPPSAELRHDQRDDQSLPPYEVLDPIIEAYVERDQTREDLIAA